VQSRQQKELDMCAVESCCTWLAVKGNLLLFIRPLAAK
jgi:hypothetical protein